MADEPKRPLGVTIVGVLYLLAGLLVFVVGLATLGIGAFDNPTDFEGWSQGAILAAGGVLTLVGLINLAIAAGCFKGWGWVWTLALLIAVVDIIIAIFNTWRQHFSSQSIVGLLIGLIIPLIIIWYLTKQNVKVWFGKA
jgi:hypothetical protein